MERREKVHGFYTFNQDRWMDQEAAATKPKSKMSMNFDRVIKATGITNKILVLWESLPLSCRP